MYCASPRTPCSGPKSAASRTRGAAWSRSAAWTRVRVTAVGLQTSPTVRPAIGRNRRRARTSSPGRTGSAAREREREREPARLVLRVRGIAQVPVGAGAEVGVVDGVRHELHPGRLAGGVHGDAQLEGAGERRGARDALAGDQVEEGLDRRLQAAGLGGGEPLEVEPPLERGPL